jgi:transposase
MLIDPSGIRWIVETDLTPGYIKKIRRQQLQSGRVERPLQTRHGPVSRVTPEIEEQLRQQPDLTLWELGEGLKQSHQVQLSRTRLSQVLQRLELRRKKNPSTRPSRIVPRHNNNARSGGKR